MGMSALTVTSQLSLNLRGNQVAGPVPSLVNKELTFTAERSLGTGAGKSNQLHASNRVLAGAADEDLDLNGTTLLNPAGVAIELDQVKKLIIKNRSAETLTVAVDGVAHTATAASIKVTFPTVNGFLGPFAADTEVTLAPGDVLDIEVAEGAGWAVTAGTGDLVNVLNLSGATEAAFFVYVEGGEV